MKSRCTWAASASLLPLCLMFGGCSSGGFDDSKVRYMLESVQLPMDGEQVMISDAQVQCGVQSDLWDLTQLGPNRAIGKLTRAATDLHFGDDVVIGEQGMHQPYVQIRGTFQLHVLDVGSIRDEGEKFKLADVKVGVDIPHPCFRDSFPQLMAIRRGRFTQDALPTFRFRLDDNWSFDRVQH